MAKLMLLFNSYIYLFRAKNELLCAKISVCTTLTMMGWGQASWSVRGLQVDPEKKGHIPMRMAGLPPGGPVTQSRNQDRPPRSGV